MPQSLSCLLVQIIFSTKDRELAIESTIRPVVHAYLATVVRNANCECYRVGGTADHVHLAVRLCRTGAVASLVETLKTSSSKWMKTEFPRLSTFAWQRGYSAFSVGFADLQDLIRYIDNQEEHHLVHSFQDEYRFFLAQNGVKCDERYLWD